MKLMSNARVNSLQVKVRAQALAIEELQRENRKQAERIAGLEALLYSAGVMDKDAFLAEPEEKAWLASVMLAGVDERTREREEPLSALRATPKTPEGGSKRDVEDAVPYGKDGGAV